MIVWRGLHQSGYIIWFTALFPYFVMITLLVKALTLDGASDGLKAYINVSATFAYNLSSDHYSNAILVSSLVHNV